MNSVYPHYVGPTVAYRRQSLYPSWLRNVLDIIGPLPEPVDAVLAGVIVRFSVEGVIPQSWRIPAGEVAPSLRGVLPRRLMASLVPLAKLLGYDTLKGPGGVDTTQPPGVEVDNEGAGL